VHARVAVAVDDGEFELHAVRLRRRRRLRRGRDSLAVAAAAAREEAECYEGCGSSCVNGSNVPSGPAVSTSSPKKRVMYSPAR